MSGQSPMTAAARLARRLARPVAEADRARAALHLLDWTGCAVAGARSDAARAMRIAAGPCGDLLYWGALGNILEMDDVDKRALLHPGPVVVPAALAAADRAGASASTFLGAVVRGYEAMIRVGRAVGPDHYRYWHNTGTCGPFGAAAAAADIDHLNTEQCAAALGLAGTQASGLWQVRHEPRSHAKQLHTARSADSGLLAASLVRAGFGGLMSIFEGPQGFFAATCGDADPEAVLDFEEDAPWAIHEVSFKPWSACRHAHAAIDAALLLRAGGVRPESVACGRIAVYRDAVVFCDKPAPADSLSARFSLQHAVAVTLIGGAPKITDFEGESLARPDVGDLRRRLAVVEDPAITARYPARFGARLELDLSDGSRRTAEVADALGDPENPMSDEELRVKALSLMRRGGMSAAAAERLAASALSLAHGGSLGAYLDLLRGGLAE
ncbi:MAG: MmgE/PrpD family protein [Parvularculaceae bacterium]|nr:MmgE/PrpD family protein [Parvularculaceae bacterium]